MNNKLFFPKKPFSSHGGIRISHNKTTSDSSTVILPIPDHVTIPMSMHIGVPCIPTVSVGDHVCVGQKIADSEAVVSAPIHASVSGTVKEIKTIELPNGTYCDAIVIESDGKMTACKYNPQTLTDANSLITAARECGLVGLGGAGFPTHIKFKIPEGKKIDTLIVNFAECEPYLTSDYREVIENSWDIMSGIYMIKKVLDIHRVIIGIEENKPQAIQILNSIAENKNSDPNNEVRILKLKSSYPQGAEKILIQTCTGRHVPEGKLPADVSCLVMNVTSIAYLSRYIKSGIPIISKRITVDGTAVPKPMNIIAPIGTSVGNILDFVGADDEGAKILLGGPMMGVAIPSRDMPILKNTNGIIVMKQKDASLPQESSCIRCGKCIDACPMSLAPVIIANAIKKNDLDAAKKLNLLSCMECGCCTYTCPAKRQLVQTFRLGKSLLKKATQKQ